MNGLEEKTYIFGTIFTISNKLQILGDKMDTQLTVKQWLFLAGVLKCENDSPTLSQIASRIGSSRQNVKKMALILENRGFVSLRKDEEDARALRVILTDSCRVYLKQRRETELRFIEQVFDGFEPHELSALFSAIKRLEGNVGDMERTYDEKEA